MAETFKNQVDALTGFAGTEDDALSDWLTAGAKEIVNLLPDNLLYKCEFTSTLSNSPTSLTSLHSYGKILSVARNDGVRSFACRYTSYTDSLEQDDPDNMFHYATKRDPIYYIFQNDLFVRPIPTSSENALVRYVLFPSVGYGDATINNFLDEAEYLVVLYAAIKALQRLMNAKRGSLPDDISSIALSPMPSSIPEFEEPSGVVIPSAPADANVSFTDVPTFPTFVKPVFNGVPPTYNEVIVAPDFGDANTWLNTEEDSEMVASRISVIQGQLQEHQSKMQNELNKFNEDNTEYQSKLQQYSTDIQNESGKIQNEVQEYQQQVQKSMQTYQAETGYDMSKYQAEVQANVQKFQNDLSNNTSKFTNDLQNYSSEVQKVSQDNQMELSKYGQDMQNYGSKIQKLSTDYQWYQGQQAQLKQDYQQGIQILIGGGNPPQQQGER